MSVIDRPSDKHDELNRRMKRPAPQSCECVLTSRDYTLLEAWLNRVVERELKIDPMLVTLVRAKLAKARIVLSGDIELDRAKGGSRVVYALDGAAPVSQLLAHWQPETIAESILPITSLLGISLLGMKARQRLPLVTSEGSFGGVWVLGGVWFEAVSPHPSGPRTAHNASACPAAGGFIENEPPRERAAAQEVPSKVLPFPSADKGRKSISSGRPAGPDEPDPGPAAA